MTVDGLRLRASPAYELVAFERLSAAARRAHAALAADADFYGVLRPRRGGPPRRAVDRESALLLHTLREPGPLPAYLGRGRDAAPALAALRALVLDGVVEVAAGNGTYASGAGALTLLDRPAAAAAGRCTELSVEALRLAAALPASESRTLARWLYDHHREPLTPAWSRRVPDARALRAWLGLGSGGAAARALGRVWRASVAGKPWIQFTPRAQPASSGAKLYVSPRLTDLPAALVGVARALARAGPVPFKVVARPESAGRADRLVAYFPSLDDLRRACAALERELDGLPAHGVPFTAAVTADGMLSWGVDPPERSMGSWRAWLCARLAEHVLAARRARVADVAAEALARIAADGVDPDTWAPLPGRHAARARAASRTGP